MALAYVTGTTKANGVSTTLTADYPASGLQAGDLALVLVSFGGGSGITLSNLPSGYTAVPNTRINSTTTFGTEVYYKILAGTESGSITWTLSGSQNNSSQMYVIRGANQVNPINISNSQANASSATVTAPSITTTVDGCMLVFFGTVAAVATYTAPSGMTERLDANSTETAELLTTTQGASGTKAATATSAGVNTGILVAVTPNYALDRGESRMVARGLLRGAA